jgi:hypothetical protein
MKTFDIESPVDIVNEHKILEAIAQERTRDEKESNIKNNEHLATYYEHFIHADYLCIVTEYCPV